MIESFFVRLQARRPEFSSAFSFAFGVLAPGAVWNCFRFGFAMLLIGRCQRFALSLFCFCFCFSLPHAGLVQVIRNLFCLVLGSCRFGRPLSVSGLPYGRFRIPSGAFCPFFSVLCSFPLCRGSLRSSRPQPAVPRLSFAPFPAGSVPDFGYAVIPLPTEKRDPVRFRNGPLRLAEESIASARTGMSGARLFSERYCPAMRRTGFSLSAGVRPRTA